MGQSRGLQVHDAKSVALNSELSSLMHSVSNFHSLERVPSWSPVSIFNNTSMALKYGKLLLIACLTN